MNPLFSVLVLGVLGVIGGLALAPLIAIFGRPTPALVVSRRLALPSPSMINMAHIQVEGVGGLGLVATAVAVAMWDPRIRLAMIVAAALGAGLALVLIAMRQGSGALPSGGVGPEDRSMLPLKTNSAPVSETHGSPAS
jgi:hypothetical protein